MRDEKEARVGDWQIHFSGARQIESPEEAERIRRWAAEDEKMGLKPRKVFQSLGEALSSEDGQ